ncbi:hypothetical protein [Labrenzia sp. VG12]|uniref:hypothetical protein n=1 Tax=Labrenzia sp. VG12 TaxID=2021862 RepID=UPI0018E03463|nr:hypothetical protein [Labrenzia sp. VG12]
MFSLADALVAIKIVGARPVDQDNGEDRNQDKAEKGEGNECSGTLVGHDVLLQQAEKPGRAGKKTLKPAAIL